MRLVSCFWCLNTFALSALGFSLIDGCVYASVFDERLARSAEMSQMSDTLPLMSQMSERDERVTWGDVVGAQAGLASGVAIYSVSEGAP